MDAVWGMSAGWDLEGPEHCARTIAVWAATVTPMGLAFIRTHEFAPVPFAENCLPSRAARPVSYVGP